jgi:hypothetical protein
MSLAREALYISATRQATKKCVPVLQIERQRQCFFGRMLPRSASECRDAGVIDASHFCYHLPPEIKVCPFDQPCV